MLYIKTLSTIRTMAEGGKLLYDTLMLLKSKIRPGISTKELNKIAEEYIINHNALPSFKGYSGFPAGVCTSVNDVVIHGIPSEHVVLREGDIVSLDCGVFYKGFHTDAARTFAVGEIRPELQRLIDDTEKSFFEGAAQACVGNRVSDIGHAVEAYLAPRGYGIVRDFTGHGVGNEIHESPSVCNYGKPGRGIRLQNGMTLAIEPMVTLGGDGVRILDDEWTTVTTDGSFAAHYENTVSIVDGSPVILTNGEAEL